MGSSTKLKLSGFPMEYEAAGVMLKNLLKNTCRLQWAMLICKCLGVEQVLGFVMYLVISLIHTINSRT